MDQIKEIDLTDRCVTVGPRISMMKLNEELSKSVCSIPIPRFLPLFASCGRSRGADLVTGHPIRRSATCDSFEIVLPTSEIIRSATRGKKIRKSWNRVSPQAPVHGASRNTEHRRQATLEIVPKPEAEFAAFFAFDDYLGAIARSMAS